MISFPSAFHITKPTLVEDDSDLYINPALVNEELKHIVESIKEDGQFKDPYLLDFAEYLYAMPEVFTMLYESYLFKIKHAEAVENVEARLNERKWD